MTELLNNITATEVSSNGTTENESVAQAPVKEALRGSAEGRAEGSDDEGACAMRWDDHEELHIPTTSAYRPERPGWGHFLRRSCSFLAMLGTVVVTLARGREFFALAADVLRSRRPLESAAAVALRSQQAAKVT